MNKENNLNHKMIPLRIKSTLSKRLDSFHEDTKIPKNTIVQMSLNKFNEVTASECALNEFVTDSDLISMVLMLLSSNPAYTNGTEFDDIIVFG